MQFVYRLVLGDRLPKVLGAVISLTCAGRFVQTVLELVDMPERPAGLQPQKAPPPPPKPLCAVTGAGAGPSPWQGHAALSALSLLGLSMSCRL